MGLAAGLDKNAKALGFFSNIGLGALEVGTVTPLPQEGNLKPRLFRYPDIHSLRNSMGFPNDGMDIIERRIASFRGSSKNTIPIGINLGKNRDTPMRQAFRDYQILYDRFDPLADYLVINISSPNTPGLLKLQQKKELERILDSLSDSRRDYPCPLFIKVAPDIDRQALKELVAIGEKYHLSGLIATNTASMESYGAGGMSGEILKEKANQTRKMALALTKDSPLEIIGCGGISSFEDILEFWKEGGHIVQIYTALIYKGPSLLREIKDKIDQLMKEKNAGSPPRTYQGDSSVKILANPPTRIGMDNHILIYLTDTENQWVVWPLFLLAIFRVLLELLKVKLHHLPITQTLEEKCAFFHGSSFHQAGLYLGIGYILLFIPTLI